MVKTAIKLLLVFIEYNESNYILLIDAVRNVAAETETIPWSNLIGVMSGELKLNKHCEVTVSGSDNVIDLPKTP